MNGLGPAAPPLRARLGMTARSGTRLARCLDGERITTRFRFQR